MLSSTLTSLTQLETSDGLNLASLPDFIEKMRKSGISITMPANHNQSEEYFALSIRRPFLETVTRHYNAI